MNKHEELAMYDLFKGAFKAVVPEMISEIIDTKSRLEELGDTVKPSEAAWALGVDKAVVSRWIKNGDIETITLLGMTRPKLLKKDLVKLIAKSV